jgi:hypothetical protein
MSNNNDIDITELFDALTATPTFSRPPVAAGKLWRDPARACFKLIMLTLNVLDLYWLGGLIAMTDRV